MELIKQTADLLAAAAPAGNPSQTGKAGKAEPGREDKDFDAMLRQKSQETGGDQKAGTAQKDGEAARKGEAKAEEKELRQTENAGEEQPAEAQQLLAAALLYQRPVEVVEQPVQTEEAAVQTAAEVLADAAPVQAVQVQLPDGAQTQLQEETQQPVRTQAAVPEQEAPQAAVPAQEAPQAMEAKVVEASQAAAEAPAEESALQQEQPQDGLKRAAASTDRPAQEAEAEKTPEDAPEAPVPEQAVLAKETPAEVKAPEKAPEGTVELEAPEGPPALANMLQGALDKGESMCIIQFKPENLGVVQVTFSRNKDGVLQILMEAANPKTAALLQKNSADIQNILAETLQGETRLEVRQTNMLFPDQWDGHNQQQQQQQQNQGQRRGREKEDLDDFMHRLRLGLTGLDGED